MAAFMRSTYKNPAILLLMLLLMGCAHPNHGNFSDQVSVYRAFGKPQGDDGIAISPMDNRAVFYSGEYRDEVWKGDIGVRFAPKLANGIWYADDMGFSVPENIADRREWDIEGYHCAAAPEGASQFMITCIKADIVSLTRYSMTRGVIGFNYPSQIGVYWFDLVRGPGALQISSE